MNVHEVTHRTPNGKPLRMLCREVTSDQRIVVNVAVRDEYRVAGLEDLGSPAVDVGAHIGAFAVSLAIDHGVEVIALEPIPSNAALLAENAALNGVEHLVMIDARAASAEPSLFIRYGYDGQEWVGELGEGEPRRRVMVGGVTLPGLLADWAVEEVSLLKIDCEGCEESWLADPALERVRIVVGEIHGSAWSGLQTRNNIRIEALDAYHFRAERE